MARLKKHRRSRGKFHGCFVVLPKSAPGVLGKSSACELETSTIRAMRDAGLPLDSVTDAKHRQFTRPETPPSPPR
jgi:hypothetical protein